MRVLVRPLLSLPRHSRISHRREQHSCVRDSTSFQARLMSSPPAPGPAAAVAPASPAAPASSGHGEPLAKRAKPNPTETTPATRSPPSTLPFDPAHEMASEGSDRPSLPSMASLMSPDPNGGASTLPAPPNTAAFPPPLSAGPGSLGLGLGGFPPAPVAPLQIKLLAPEAKAPTRGSAFAAGYDIYAAESCRIPQGGRKLVSTGIACAVPSGTCEFADNTYWSYWC